MQFWLASFSLLILFVSCSTVPKVPRPDTGGAEAADIKIIDAHTHTPFVPGTVRPPFPSKQTQDDYFAALAEANAVGAVAHGFYDGSGTLSLRSRNVLHCAGVGTEVNRASLENGLRSGQFSCIKIYLGYIFRYAYDPAYEPVYALAQKYDVPVIFHTGDTVTKDGLLKFADPLTVDEVAVKHRKVRFVIAHCGNPWIESAAEVAYKNENVYLDGSALLIGNMDELPPETVEKYVVEPLRWIFGYIEDPSKLMFGSDWPLSNIAAYKRAFQRAIPEEHWNAVFYENARRVFKFPDKPLAEQARVRKSS